MQFYLSQAQPQLADLLLLHVLPLMSKYWSGGGATSNHFVQLTRNGDAFKHSGGASIPIPAIFSSASMEADLHLRAGRVQSVRWCRSQRSGAQLD
jgi:hypothetical protein